MNIYGSIRFCEADNFADSTFWYKEEAYMEKIATVYVKDKDN